MKQIQRTVVIDADDVRRLALALPHSMEIAHFGTPSFRVGGKIFATWSPSERRMTLKFSPADQAALLAMDPDTFHAEAHWGRFGWTRVDLRRVSATELADLLRQSWRGVAAKSLQSAE